MSPHPISDDQLIAYANNELDGVIATTIATHSATCARCRKFITTFNLVRTTLRQDDTRLPPPTTVRQAEGIFTRARTPRPFLSFQLQPAHVLVAFTLGLIALGLGAAIGIAAQDIAPDSALYPIKNVVETFQTTVSDTWRSLGGSRGPNQPLSTPTPRRTSTPTGTITPEPLKSPTINPGQAQTPSGQIKTPPGQAQTPPGQIKTPPGQAQTPPGQIKTPPGQAQTPPGQIKTPPGQAQTPPGQIKTPPGQANTPPASGKPSEKNAGDSKDDKKPPEQQKTK